MEKIDRQKLKDIARSIHEARKVDLGISTEPAIRGYIKDRNLWEYISILEGLEVFLNYVKGLSPNSLLLDIGAGTTQAMYDLSLHPMGADISVMTTGLAKNLDAERLIRRDRYLVTPVETLKGVEENSVAGILGVNSIAYSGALDLAANKVDSVLIPGGALKATFPNTPNGRFFHSHYGFTEELKSIGYDIAIKQSGFLSIVLAIKPGNSPLFKAADLLSSDHRDMYRQQDVISGRNISSKSLTGY